MVLQAAAADFTSGPYDVGDYYFDGMSEGVVVEVDPTGSKGKLIAMHDAGGGRFCRNIPDKALSGFPPFRGEFRIFE